MVWCGVVWVVAEEAIVRVECVEEVTFGMNILFGWSDLGSVWSNGAN